MTTALAITQQLETCEAVIERGMTTFIEVGAALLDIRDNRLYRQEYRDFETYCQTRWAMGRRRANQLIEAADVVGRLGTMVPNSLPSSERQARELSGLPTETAAQVMQEAHEVTKGKPTATVIREVRERIENPNPEPVLSQEDCEELDDTEWCDCGDGLCECVMGECSCGVVPELPESDRPDWEVKGEAAIEYFFDRPLPEPVPEKRITGTDGKSYPAPKPSREKPNRRPITDAFRDAAYDLGKRVTTLTNLADDDRFKRNAGQLAERNLSELTRARDALQRVIDQLTT